LAALGGGAHPHKFFLSRRPVDLGLSDYEALGELADYVNVPPLIGMAISGDFALLGPLSTSLSVEDLHDILEVKRVDAHNRRLVAKMRERERSGNERWPALRASTSSTTLRIGAETRPRV
jgi:hypothetical protein